MADKKKNTSRPATRASLKTNEKDQPVKSISAMARDEAKNTKEQTKAESTSSVKSISAMARDERTNVKEQTKPESKASVKSISAMARDERTNKSESKASVKTSTAALRSEPKKDRAVQESRVRRDSKEPAWFLRFRNSRVGRFVFDAYYELRHKVTWPTFEEARNMTLIVIVLSAIIGAALALVDFGLYHLFILISGG